MHCSFSANNYLVWILFLGTVLLPGCTPNNSSSLHQSKGLSPVIGTLTPVTTIEGPTPLQTLGTVAVARIDIEHPSARLVYKNTGVSDNIVRHLTSSGQYRVIDWTRLQNVLFRRNLQWSDLQDDQTAMNEVHNVLLNDYFLMGTITSYSERIDYSSSAFSKSKTQIVNTTIELSLKDALTNEIVASALGTGERSRQVTQNLGFGAAGSSDSVLANIVLDDAINSGVVQLSTALEKTASLRKKHPSNNATVQTDSKALGIKSEPKILFIFSEENKSADKPGETAENKSFGVSLVEHTMAKEFNNANCQIVTADDLLNKAYTVGDSENILLTGWVTEKEILDLENLMQARTGLASYALDVGRAAKADIVVTGTVQFQVQNKENPVGVKAVQSSVFLTAKAISVVKGKVLKMASTQQSFLAILSPSGLDARTKAVTLASKKAARELMAILNSDPQ